MEKDRDRLINYFEGMKGLEESTRDYYIKVSSDQNFDNQEVKDTFKRISGDEQKHADIMGKIINLIKNNI